MTEPVRFDWQVQQALDLYQQPFNTLLFQAQTTHRKHFDPNQVQISTLLSIKTGACPEDCKYCPQSARYDTDLTPEALLEIETVVNRAKQAKAAGASRFCMGAAWRNPPEREMPKLLHMIQSVKALGMETCMTLGMLSTSQAQRFAKAGLDYYNHNLDTSESFYEQIISTRKYQDRLNTLNAVRQSGMKVCSGGILGMGETINDRLAMLTTLANFNPHPESVPINMLVKVPGTPMEKAKELDPFDFIRMVATARIMMPTSFIRLSAGREQMNEQTQALCFIAGANSIFYGEKLLTTQNPQTHEDLTLFHKLGIEPLPLNIEAESTIKDEGITTQSTPEKTNDVQYWAPV